MERPRFIDIEPRQLWVDDTYQRSLAEKSIRLIRDIVRNWDWRNYKPPVVTKTPTGGYHVIDGQHTAIAAASHPKIKLIPVMLVEAETVQERASAFIGQNTNRVAMTTIQLFRAAVAAGDEDAMTVQQVCDRARVEIVLNPHVHPKPRRTMAVSALKSLARRRGAMVARQILEAVADSGISPIGIIHLRAAEILVRELDDALTLPELIAVLRARPIMDVEFEARRLAKDQTIPLYQALAKIWDAHHRCAQQFGAVIDYSKVA
jgi:hypothetical protein